MLNLSQMARDSAQFSLLYKLRRIRDPDIYLAENIADYKTSVDKLKFDWYKRFPYFDKSQDRVYISFMNVGLRVIDDKINQGVPSWFRLHDNTGEEVIYWDSKNNLVPTLMTYEEVQESQGIGEDEFMYEVFTRYLMESKLLSVIEVNKYNLTKKKRKMPLADRIRDLLPHFEGELQPGY